MILSALEDARNAASQSCGRGFAPDGAHRMAEKWPGLCCVSDWVLSVLCATVCATAHRSLGNNDLKEAAGQAIGAGMEHTPELRELE